MNVARPKQDVASAHRAKFADIRVLADAACLAAKRAVKAGRRNPFDGEPVNWGDLGCQSVEWYVSDSGSHGYSVVLSEAAPGCENLALYVQRYLAERGHPEVSVTTEW
jgi:hypothetical protein